MYMHTGSRCPSLNISRLGSWCHCLQAVWLPFLTPHRLLLTATVPLLHAMPYEAAATIPGILSL